MEKGLDIAFQLNGRDDRNTVLALADLTGNFFATHLDIQWRVFLVTLGDQKYSASSLQEKVLEGCTQEFTGK